MKKIYLLILAFCLSFISCYSQPRNNIERNQTKNELLDSISNLKKRIINFENQLILSDSAFKSKFNCLTNALDSTNRIIIDSRLRESLKSAESTINKLDTFIDSFSVIYAIISIIIILLTIGLPLIIQQLSIKPMKDEIKDDHLNVTAELEKIRELRLKIRAEKIEQDQSTESLLRKFESDKDKMFQQITMEFESKFQEQMSKSKKGRMDQAVINLASDQPNFITNACSYLSLTPIEDFEEDHIFKIVRVLKKQTLSNDRSEMLVYKIAGKKCDFTDDFFESLPKLTKINTINTRNAGYTYFAESGTDKFKLTIVELILNSEDPTSEYSRIFKWWQSDHEKNILEILNFEELQIADKINLKKILEKLSELNNYSGLEQQIKETVFYKKLVKFTSPN
jgi:hypothetical protein